MTLLPTGNFFKKKKTNLIEGIKINKARYEILLEICLMQGERFIKIYFLVINQLDDFNRIAKKNFYLKITLNESTRKK